MHNLKVQSVKPIGRRSFEASQLVKKKKKKTRQHTPCMCVLLDLIRSLYWKILKDYFKWILPSRRAFIVVLRSTMYVRLFTPLLSRYQRGHQHRALLLLYIIFAQSAAAATRGFVV